MRRSDPYFSPLDVNVNELLALISGAASKSGLCKPKPPSLSGKITASSYDKCCEGTGISRGSDVTGSVTGNFPFAECVIPLEPPWSFLAVTGGIGGSISLSGSGGSSPCTGDCAWSISGSTTITAKLGGEAALVHRNILRVEGGVEGSASLTGKKTCNKPAKISGCIGPVKARVAVVSANCIKDEGKVVLWQKYCW